MKFIVDCANAVYAVLALAFLVAWGNTPDTTWLEE